MAIIAILVTSSIRVIDTGNRGVLLHFGAVDISKSLEEGIRFVVPVRDEVVQMEVRTQKYQRIRYQHLRICRRLKQK